MEKASKLSTVRLDQKVLVVDDDHDFAQSVGELIGSYGCQVEVVATPAAAREMLATFCPAVALIDVRLGKYSGIDLLEEFVNLPAAPTCIMITGYASTGSAVETLTAGAYDYLTKPVAPSALFATLDRCFDRIRLENERAEALYQLEARNRELEHVNQRLQQVVDCMGDISSCTSVVNLCNLLLEEVASNMGADGGSVYLREGDRLVLAHSLDPGHAPPVIPMPLNPGTVLGRVMEGAESVLVSNAASSEGLMLSGWSGYRDESLLALPLMGQDGETLGVLSLHTKQQPPFTPQDRDIGRILLSASCETLRAVQALEELQASDEHIRLLLDSTHEGIYGVDPNGNCTFANASCLQMLGYSEADMLGLNAAKQVHHIQPPSPDTGTGDCRICLALTGARDASLTEAEMWRADGTGFPAEFRAVPILKGEKIIGCVITFRDITERVTTEEKLQESTNMLQLIVDSEPECVKVLDKNLNLLQMNPAGLSMIEADSMEEVAGCCVEGIIEPEYREAFIKMTDEVFKGNSGLLEFKITGLKGTRRWLEIHAVPLRKTDQEIIGLVGVTRDITESKIVQMDLQESQDMLQLIIDSVPVCVKILDRNGNILRMNNTGLRMLDAGSFDEVKGMNFYPMTDPAYREELRKMNERVLNDGAPGKMEFELTGLRGRKIWLHTHVVPLPGECQDIIGVLAVTRDITETRSLVEKTHQQKMQLIQANKMAALGTLVAGVAHEINNPNQTIQINSGLVSRVWEDAVKVLDEYAMVNGEFNLAGLPYGEVKNGYTEIIHDINDAARQIKIVVDQLRDVARPYDGTATQKPVTPVNLNDVVETAIALLKHCISKRTSEFHYELGEDLPSIMGMRQHLQQIVINLVLNSLEALPDKTSGIWIETCFNEDQSSVELRVRDEGVGIQPAAMEQIMEPFFTTKRDTGGTGLGLSITHSLTQAQGGTLHFESEPGKGTLAIVRFPVTQH